MNIAISIPLTVLVILALLISVLLEQNYLSAPRFHYYYCDLVLPLSRQGFAIAPPRQPIKVILLISAAITLLVTPP
jgi:hypothetical protein